MADVSEKKFKKSIYQYANYRDFLNDYYSNSKEVNKSFTFRYFAKLAGFGSCGFFKLILQGKRNLAPEGIEKIAKALNLNKEESFFFFNLVLFNQAITQDDKRLFADQLLKSREYKKLHPLSEAQYSYFSKWYLVSIRELAGLSTFQEDPEWIAQKVKPEITVPQAKKALEDLIKLGLLKRDQNGKLVQAEANISTPDEVVSVYLANYHVDMMSKGQESIKRFPREKREISSVTFGMSQENVRKIKEIIYECRKKILDITTGDPQSNSVYQLNFQLFPLAELDGENKEEVKKDEA
jgi:uncharacterized protein (TIGR02147 family)